MDLKKEIANYVKEYAISKGIHYSIIFGKLYTEFFRIYNVKKKLPNNRKSMLDKIDSINMLPELKAVCVRLYTKPEYNIHNAEFEINDDEVFQIKIKSF